MPITISGSTGVAGVDGSAASPAVQGGDTNTGMFFPAADTIAFAKGGAEVLRINSSSQVEFQAGSASLPAVVRNNDTNTGLYWPAQNALSISVAGTEKFRFAASGQIGIGGENYGTAGQVLTSSGSSAAPVWASPTSWVPIGTYTADNVAAIVVTDLGAYSTLRITFNNVRPTTDASTLRLRISSDNGATFINTNYTSQDGGGTGTTAFALTGNIGNLTTDGPATGQCLVGNFNLAVKTSIICSAVSGNESAARTAITFRDWQTNNNAMNAIRIFAALTGTENNLLNGTFVIEGLI